MASIPQEAQALNQLLAQIDLEALTKLTQQVDLAKLVTTLGTMDGRDLQRLAEQIGAAGGKAKQERAAPPINGDMLDIASELPADQRAKLAMVREYMEREIRPIIGNYWERGEFPHQIIPGFAAMIQETFGDLTVFPHPDPLLVGLLVMELARVDASISTFLGVHWGLCMGSIACFGSPEQKQRWLPAMQRFELIGSWALTEPEVGSGTAAGLQTTARREGDTWVINGAKKWSGNATFADLNVIWARDVADNQVKGFVVELGTPGYIVEKLPGKIALRVVENVLITLNECRVPEANRLPGANAFRDVSQQLAVARALVAWKAVGAAMGAYERSLAYATSRKQFGKPIAAFQLVQEKLVRMLANLSAMQSMMLQISRLHARAGDISHERASLAKLFCSEKLRESVALGRELFGGNGILLEHEIGRYFADAESIYSYEGTYDMNLLIVGRAITGQSAFV
jgi:glutaryl-CoA dehydrogenase